MLEKILIAPYITEKSTALSQKNQYVFRVWQKANKNEIKKEIENLYKVKVVGVKIINVPAKERRLGRISGWKKGFKKAIVKIKEGQKIEVMPK
jgi:large subunit ribosomal protein L23